MMRLFDTLVGRTVLVSLIAISLMHVLSLWGYESAVNRELVVADETRLAERLVAIRESLRAVPAAERDGAAHRLSSGPVEVHWSLTDRAVPGGTGAEPWEGLPQRVQSLAADLKPEWFSGRGGAGGRAYADPAGVAAYLTTIRTTLGSRTMYQGVRTLRPGEWLTVDLVGGRVATRSVVVPPRDVARDVSRGSASGEGLRAVVEQSVRAHLRSDVPLCCLLSGGLDSTIIATVAQRELGGLHTYCAGAIGDGPRGEDFGWAAQVASRLGTTHREVGVTRGLFAQRVPEMIQAMGVPLSTPNEVAIHEVARAMRADGKVVTLSGEGADELFGGYDQVLAQAASFEALLGETPFACVRDRARHSASCLHRFLRWGCFCCDFWRTARISIPSAFSSANWRTPFGTKGFHGPSGSMAPCLRSISSSCCCATRNCCSPRSIRGWRRHRGSMLTSCITD